jgi:hypothetical protein
VCEIKTLCAGRAFYQEGGTHLTALRWEVARVKGHHSKQVLDGRRGGDRKGGRHAGHWSSQKDSCNFSITEMISKHKVKKLRNPHGHQRHYVHDNRR